MKTLKFILIIFGIIAFSLFVRNCNKKPYTSREDQLLDSLIIANDSIVKLNGLIKGSQKTIDSISLQNSQLIQKINLQKEKLIQLKYVYEKDKKAIINTTGNDDCIWFFGKFPK